MKNSFFIATYGCQMNDYDSLVIESILKSEGYVKTESPENAEIIIVNGCAVRKHAEERALGFLGSFSSSEKKSKFIILAGCLSRALSEIPPYVDILASPTEYLFLPAMIKNKKSDISLSSSGDYTKMPVESKITLLTPISKGCSNFCSYCIVPYLRGEEISFSPESIIGQIKRSKTDMSREILLMGQNVNSYNYKNLSFTELAKIILCEFKGMRIRFITSHPKDFSIDTVKLMHDNNSFCMHLHLPLQSGSDRMLFLMRRKYTIKDYKKIVSEAKSILPNLVLTSDLIVGLPYETEDDFKQTMDAVESIRFDDCFTYKHSKRRYALSSIMPEIQEKIAIERLKMLIEKQQKIKLEKIKEMKDNVFEVLVEKQSRKSKNDSYGRDSGNRPVIIKECSAKPGDICRVRITQISGTTPAGVILEER